MSTKVFVGNLAFRTTDQALVEAFGKHGEVKSGVIITRGRRSLGYGFVEFATTEQAAASVDKMNKAEIFGRQIKVELAKDPAERPEEGPARRRRHAGNDGNDSSNRSPATYNSASTTTSNTNSNTSSPNVAANNKERNQSNTGNSDKRNNNNPNRRRKRTNRSDRNSSGGENNNTSSPAAPASSPSPQQEKPQRPPREQKEKVPSKTTLFVANLPFSVDDAQLLLAFKEAKAKAAHVVQTKSGRSRGYGFVEFETEADQQEALKNLNGKPITGKTGPSRNMSVSISHTPPPDAAPASN